MTEEQYQVLVVDDSRVIRRAASKILASEFDVIEAEDGDDAWRQIQENKRISVVFSDLGMPNMDGYQLLETVRNAEDQAVANIPIIIITGAEEDEGAKEKAFGLGATDFIGKPFDSVSLKTRASAHINYRRELQSLEQRVATDKLTGLLTDKSFLQQGEQALAYAQRHGTDFSVVRLDLGKFSELFVKYGKGIGEQILVKVTDIIKQGLRREDSAARLGVAKFGLILPCADGNNSALVVKRICQRIAGLKLKLGKDVFTLSYTAGISQLDGQENLAFDALLKQVNEALQQAQAAGHNQVIIYQSDTGAGTAEAQPREEAREQPLDRLLQKLKTSPEAVTRHELLQGMMRVMPMLQQANRQLNLGIEDAIALVEKEL